MSVFAEYPEADGNNHQEDIMNITTTQSFVELQTGIDEATAELDKLVQYCRDTMATDPNGALGTVQDLAHRIQDAADLVRAHVTIFKRRARRAS